MLHQPTNITPSSLANIGNTAVSAYDALTVTWQLNGDTPLVAYKIDFYLNNSTSQSLFSTGKVTVSPSVAPKDKYGDPVFFAVTPGYPWSHIGVSNGNTYKYKITQYWGTGTNDYTEQYSDTVFSAVAEPDLSIVLNYPPEAGNVFPSPHISMTANVQLGSGDAVRAVRWVVSHGAIIDDTGYIETPVLDYEYDGITPDSHSSYTVACYIQTQLGMTAQAERTFDCFYETTASPDFTAKCNCDGSVTLNCPIDGIKSIPGTATPASGATFSGGNLVLAAGARVQWTTYGISAPYYIGYKGIWGSTAVEIFRLSNLAGNTLSVTAGGGRVTLYLNGSQLTYLIPGSLKAGEAFCVQISPTKFSFVGQDDATMSISLPNFDFVTVGAASNTSALTAIYMYITKTIPTNAAMNNEITPVFDSNTVMLTQFDNGTLEAGNADKYKVRFYRDDKALATVSASKPTLTDYGAIPGEKYYYMAFKLVTGEFSGNGIVPASGAVGANPEAYQLIEAAEDETEYDRYNVVSVWSFRSNAEDMSIGNGNEPTLLANFTKYPLRQGSSQAPRSGTLSALLSNPIGGVYKDTYAQLQALYALSQTDNALFLKHPKGFMYRVHISSPITGTVNLASNTMPTTVSVPWIEIGDTEGVSLVKEG
nr:MAG TPA: hypothetical protein [Caudoviricetes sp.]